MPLPSQFANAVTLLALIHSVTAADVLIAADLPDFNGDVLPVFRKYCNGCHNAKEAEAGLVLLDYPRTMKGGDDGAVVVGGESDHSRLWKRMTAEDDTRMPPKDQPSPKPEEIGLIKAWIEAGAKP